MITSTAVDFYINSRKNPGTYSLEKYFQEEIYDFHQKLTGYAPTPLNRFKITDFPENLNICLKDESGRFNTGAFKSLGASWAIGSFLKQKKGKYTFCTATDGNHGKAVAWSAKIFGHSAKVFMPSSTVISRIKAIEEEGAEVVTVDGDYDNAVQKAKKQAHQNGHILIQDTSWDDYHHYPALISAGYTTMIKEIEDQIMKGHCNEPDVVILQAGVGSWAASVILYFVKFSPVKTPLFVIVEPFESDCLMESAKNNSLSTTHKSQHTIMAGLNCGTPSQDAWEIIRDLADIFISVGDGYSEKAIREFHKKGIESCESGAAGLAGLYALCFHDDLETVRKHLDLSKGKNYLIFNTEGITDRESYNNIIKAG